MTAEPPAPPDPPAEAVAVSAQAPPPVDEQPAAAEREHWLRQRFEKEHEFTLALMRLLLEGLSSESRGKRFWRWLIDDYRSERRITRDLGAPRSRDGLLLHRVLTWARLHDADHGTGDHNQGTGVS